MKLAKEQDDTAFCWTRDPEFVIPAVDGGVDACVTQEFAGSRANDLKTLLNAFLETAIGFVNARAGVVRVLLPDAQTLNVISAFGMDGEALCAENLAGLTCEECGKDSFRRGMCATDIDTCETRRDAWSHKHFNAVISIPLESRNSPGVLLGVFTLFFDTPRSSSGKSATMAASYADLLATLIEYVKSSREAKRAELLMERQSIANEIHDSLAQTVNYARMTTALLDSTVRNKNEMMTAKYVRDIDEALEMGQKAVRELITDFRCEMDPAGLLQALHTLCEQFRKQHDIVLDCSIRLADLDLPLEHEIQAFHIVQEALANIAKHSGASHARLIVEQLFGYYVFTMEDNGVGTFSPIEGHYGIIIMQERAQRIGGEIKVESIKGLGTCVQLFFPEPGANWRTNDD
ncbi:MAG: hypothetical protein IPM27_06675 [Nitrosomonadales bacterium]|nr:hypothetical protein [Nitrosomonadales bacterium]